MKNRLTELWEELLEQKPSNEDLRYIIEYVEPLRKEANKLLGRNKQEIIKEMIRVVKR